ncbi:hypothetical protein [Motilimonas eburnea]|uniref:hypothetical protein n=1 Tax=Motilimonas eburnea TaxID=1737488 RepID=UPI001E4F6043|nr:hypothetical protein [Motilimonas eburnea]MCE2571655.1 hypothetical protein [Motilimonas eburnea]
MLSNNFKNIPEIVKSNVILLVNTGVSAFKVLVLWPITMLCLLLFMVTFTFNEDQGLRQTINSEIVSMIQDLQQAQPGYLNISRCGSATDLSASSIAKVPQKCETSQTTIQKAVNAWMEAIIQAYLTLVLLSFGYFLTGTLLSFSSRNMKSIKVVDVAMSSNASIKLTK